MSEPSGGQVERDQPAASRPLAVTAPAAHAPVVQTDTLPLAEVVVNVVVSAEHALHPFALRKDFERVTGVAVEAYLFVLETARRLPVCNHRVVLEERNMDEDQDRAVPALGLICL